eukprot:5621364-Alexandrium_andersonii.AAC.1
MNPRNTHRGPVHAGSLQIRRGIACFERNRTVRFAKPDGAKRRATAAPVREKPCQTCNPQ